MTRIVKDSMGTIEVADGAYWGAVTQRSLNNFRIGHEKMPIQLIHALALIKEAAALTNHELRGLDESYAKAIEQAAEEVRSGQLDDQFPLKVWQTGSGTQTNMNVNEVIAKRGNDILGVEVLHPNDHVNLSQSSNDTIPSAMHMAVVQRTRDKLMPALQNLKNSLEDLQERAGKQMKVGRTHLQDATPIYFAQEVSAWVAMMDYNMANIKKATEALMALPLGGTAVGTGINAPKAFAKRAVEWIAEKSGIPYKEMDNKFFGLSSKSLMANYHGALNALATDTMKMANDIRWLASGPRCGFGEISLPANEPGSSIMPGKVNPTQCEAMTMVAAQVMGNHTTVTVAASQGNFELNVYMPVMIYNIMQSIYLLADACQSFSDKCVSGIQINASVMEDELRRSLMSVTVLTPKIGYDKAAKVAKLAHEESLTLKAACEKLGFLDDESFDELMTPEHLLGLKLEDEETSHLK